MVPHHARRAAALVLVSALAAACPAGAQNVSAALTAVEFDEIDHVYTTEAPPPPGSFRRNAGLVAQPVPEATKKPSPIFGALTRASSVLSGASSVVSASGELGRAARIADDAAKLAPLATAMGMAGGNRFDALVQTFVFPRVSPTGSVMLNGFLAAQTEYKAHFGGRSEPTAASPPAQLAPYAQGAMRHYTVASNGWVRIDDANTKMVLLIKPDTGKSYLIDAGSKTVRTMSYAPAAPPASGSATGTTGTADASDRVESLGTATLDGVAAMGYRTQSTLRVAGAGGACADATITSTRVEYFAQNRIASDAVNASPAASQRPDAGGCEPASTVRHAGAKVPSDRLMMYQANTVEKKAGTGTDRYTVVIERGNLREHSTPDASAFDVPAGMRQISAAAL